MSQQRRQHKVIMVRTAVVLLGVVAVTAGGVGLARHRGKPPAAGQTSLGPFQLGAQVRNRARMKLSMDMGGSAPQEVGLTGDFTTTVTDIHDGLVEVACQLSNAMITVRTGEPGAAAAPPAPATEFMPRFFMTYQTSGRAAGAWLPKGTNASVANVLLKMAGATQLVRPAQASPAWVVRERDVNGEYVATYQQTSPGRYSKQKGRYLGGAQSQNDARPAASTRRGFQGAPTIRIEHSNAQLRTDDAGRVLEADQDEALVLEIARNLSFRVTMSLALDEARTGRATELVGAFARERPQLESHALDSLGPDQKADTSVRDRRLLAGASLDDLGAALKALPVAADASREAGRALAARFAALFRLEPAAIARAPAMVRAATPVHGDVLLEALSLAARPDSQAALGVIARDVETTLLLRRNAVQVLGLQEEPSEAAVAALRASLDDSDPQLRQMAMLAYGACARSVRPVAPQRAKAIVDELVRQFGSAEDGRARADLIAALGNAGDVAALPLLQAAIQGNDSVAKGRGIQALRFLDDPAVDPLLASLLKKSSDQQARLTAIATIRYRQVGPFTEALADVAGSDPVADVRKAAIDLLGSQLKGLPGLRVVLEAVEKKDPVQQNRELASKHLRG